MDTAWDFLERSMEQKQIQAMEAGDRESAMAMEAEKTKRMALTSQEKIQGMLNSGLLQKQDLVNQGLMSVQQLKNSGLQEAQESQNSGLLAVANRRQIGASKRTGMNIAFDKEKFAGEQSNKTRQFGLDQQKQDFSQYSNMQAGVNPTMNDMGVVTPGTPFATAKQNWQDFNKGMYVPDEKYNAGIVSPPPIPQPTALSNLGNNPGNTNAAGFNYQPLARTGLQGAAIIDDTKKKKPTYGSVLQSLSEVTTPGYTKNLEESKKLFGRRPY